MGLRSLHRFAQTKTLATAAEPRRRASPVAAVRRYAQATTVALVVATIAQHFQIAQMNTMASIYFV